MNHKFVENSKNKLKPKPRLFDQASGKVLTLIIVTISKSQYNHLITFLNNNLWITFI